MLYVGTDGNGVHFVSTEKMGIIRSFRHEMVKEGGLCSNSVYSVLVDKEGLIWVGFYQLGLDYTMYQSELFTVYSYSPYFDSKDMPVRILAINENEKLIGVAMACSISMRRIDFTKVPRFLGFTPA